VRTRGGRKRSNRLRRPEVDVHVTRGRRCAASQTHERVDGLLLSPIQGHSGDSRWPAAEDTHKYIAPVIGCRSDPRQVASRRRQEVLLPGAACSSVRKNAASVACQCITPLYRRSTRPQGYWQHSQSDYSCVGGGERRSLRPCELRGSEIG
jgi:hypothetical protein